MTSRRRTSHPVPLAEVPLAEQRFFEALAELPAWRFEPARISVVLEAWFPAPALAGPWCATVGALAELWRVPLRRTAEGPWVQLEIKRPGRRWKTSSLRLARQIAIALEVFQNLPGEDAVASDSPGAGS